MLWKQCQLLTVAFVSVSGLMLCVFYYSQPQNLLPLVSATECQQCEGESSPPAPESSGDDSGGTSQTGSYRGHETERIKTIVEFLLRNVYTSIPQQVGERPRSELSEVEQDFLCSIQRIRVHDTNALQLWFPHYLADILNRPVWMVRYGLRDSACIVVVKRGW